MRSKRVVAHVLDDAAAIGERMGVLQLLGRRARKSLAQQRLDGIGPLRVDDRFVSQDRIGVEVWDERNCGNERNKMLHINILTSLPNGKTKSNITKTPNPKGLER